MARLDHPPKPEIEAVRSIILGFRHREGRADGPVMYCYEREL